MAESVILPDSATLQHIRFNLSVKGSLRRATPALDTQIEPTQISKEADFLTEPSSIQSVTFCCFSESDMKIYEALLKA